MQHSSTLRRRASKTLRAAGLSFKVFEAMTAKDVEGWDSLNHINLIVAVEKSFKVTFTTKEVNGMKNVGELMQLIQAKSPN